MSLISYSPLQDGVTGVNAAATNTPLSTIYDDYNGNITDANIAATAAIAGTKIAGGGVWQAYVPTATGWSATPTTTDTWYTQIGKVVIYRFTCSGTSNGTTAALSLPVAAKAGTYSTEAVLGLVEDNTSFKTTACRMFIDPTSSTTKVSFSTDMSSGVWTGSGTKAVRGLIIYEAS